MESIILMKSFNSTISSSLELDKPIIKYNFMLKPSSTASFTTSKIFSSGISLFIFFLMDSIDSGAIVRVFNPLFLKDTRISFVMDSIRIDGVETTKPFSLSVSIR